MLHYGINPIRSTCSKSLFPEASSDPTQLTQEDKL
jgi:hypothetical protein